MFVKASISLPEQQEAFARRMVEEGRYASLSAVIQQALENLRVQTEAKDAEIAALRALLDERRKGPFLDEDEFEARYVAMIARVKASYGL